MFKSLLCFLLLRCIVLRSTYGDTLADLSGSPTYVPTSAPSVISITAPFGEPSTAFPSAVPFLGRNSLSSQPSAMPSYFPTETSDIPSSVPFFRSTTAQPTIDPLVYTAAPENIKLSLSESPSSSPDSQTLSPGCISASVVRASQVGKTRSFSPL